MCQNMTLCDNCCPYSTDDHTEICWQECVDNNYEHKICLDCKRIDQNRMAEARWDDLDNYTMMGMTVPNSEAWADLRLERQALNCYLSTTGKPWPKIRDTAACIAWCRAP